MKSKTKTNQKRSILSEKLGIAFSKIYLEKGPEDILLEVTTATKSTINDGFSPEPLSNRGKKKAELKQETRPIEKIITNFGETSTKRTEENLFVRPY